MSRYARKSAWMFRAMPWALSLTLHLAVMAALALGVAAVVQTPRRERTVNGITLVGVAAGQLELAPAGLLDMPGPAQPAEVKLKARSASWRRARGEPSAAEPAAQTHGPAIVGLSEGLAGGAGAFVVQGQGPGAVGPGGGFFGSGNGAGHVVYVIDRSGSMQAEGAYDSVKLELADSIGRLAESQDFHVILFSDGPPLENSPGRLVGASYDNKVQAARFLDAQAKAAVKRATGLTTPVSALARAFEVLASADDGKGKVLYLLTDGLFADADAVLETIRRMNAGKSVRVFTYLYGTLGPEDPAIAVMKRIAQENGGAFRLIEP